MGRIRVARVRTNLSRLPDDEDDVLPAVPFSERTAALRTNVRVLTGAACRVCGAALCGHEALLAILLGSRSAPRCSRCAASDHGESRGSLCERSLQWIRRRDCFLANWREASAAEGSADVERPECLFADADAAGAGMAAAAAAAPGHIDDATPPISDAEHDAGDLGCGDLVIDLKFKLADMAPGSVLLVRATDPAAPVDLPAWCGLVGHTLLHVSPPRYWIRRKAR